MALTFLTNSSCKSFLTTSLSIASFNFLKSTEVGLILSTFNLFSLLFKLLKPLSTYSNSSVSNL